MLEQKQKEVLKKVLSDENFLPHLSAEETVKFLDKLFLAKTEKEIDVLIKKYQK